jgi:hypothetical protein
MSMENHGGMISLRKNSRFFNQSSLAILPGQLSSSNAGDTGRRKWWIWSYDWSCP